MIFSHRLTSAQRIDTAEATLVHYPFNDENGSIVANQETERNGTMVGGATYGGSERYDFWTGLL